MKKTLGRRWLSLLLACALCLTLIPAAFADDTLDSVGDYKISLTASSPKIEVEGEATLTATVTKNNATDDSVAVTLSTNDTDIITLDTDKKKITGKAEGTATITASCTVPDSTGGTTEISATCTVEVEPADTSPTTTITIQGGNFTLTVGEPKTMSATVEVNGSTVTDPDIKWTSSDTTKATFKNNVVTAKAAGTVQIIAEYNGTKAEVTCEIKALPYSTTIDYSTDLETIVGANTKLKAKTYPEGQMVRWESKDPEIASVDYNGSVRGLTPGETEIIAYFELSGERFESAPLKVIVTGIAPTKDTISVEENGTKTLTIGQSDKVTIRYFGKINPDSITFTSRDNFTASVTGRELRGLRVGTAVIEARAEGGKYITTFKVEVTPDSSTELPLNGSINLTTNDTLPFTKLYSDFTSQINGTVKYITNLMVDSTAHGTLYYNYSSEAEPGRGVAQTENYYINPKAGQLDPRNITFVPKPSFNGGEVFITYNAVTDTNQYSCRIRVNITRGGDGTGSDADAITQTTKYNTPVKFNGIEFDQICRNRLGSNLNYVTFSLPNERQGTLYTNYVSEGNYGSRVTLNSRYSTKDLDDVWFVPAPGFEGSVVIYYTGFAKGSSGKSYTGQVIITVGKDSASSIGGLSYEISRGGVARFDDVDFNDYCKSILDDRQTLSSIQFTALPNASQGVMYYDYRSSTNTGSLASTSTTYWYGTRTPRIDRLAFVPASDYVGIIRIPFVGQTVSGVQFSGNVEVNVRGGQSSGDISYICAPGRSVDFRNNDFTRLSNELTGRTLDYIVFDGLPSRTDGDLYYNSRRITSTGTRYYNGSGNRISNLSFRASSSFSGTIDIPFIGYDRNGVDFTGVITISSSGSSSSNTDAIQYTTDSKSAAVFDRDDFDDLSQWETDRDISTVRFDPPRSSEGDLYRNYRSSTSKGTRITSSSTTLSAGELDRVAFIPASGFTGTVVLDFEAKATNGDEFDGTVEITVERPSADVTVRYSTRTAPVDFRSSDFSQGSRSLSSIQFGSMPPTSTGYLYYRYTSPTRYERQASASTTYRASGSNLISDLTFVPRAGYTGTLILPYTGTNSNGSTFEGEVQITVSPTYSSTHFNDMGPYDNQERAAVEFLYDLGVTRGISSTEYGPELPILRGDFAVMVYNAFGMTPTGSSQIFNDVPSSARYAQAINTLYSRGIVSGVGNGNYAPNSNVSRQEAVCMVQRAMRSAGWSAAGDATYLLDSYSDGGSVASFARKDMATAVRQGYLPIRGGRLEPTAPLTRIDMAQVLHRVLTY